MSTKTRLTIVCVLALFAWLVPQQAMADDMLKEKYYTMDTYTNHVSFEVLLTDLNANNTWAKDGVIKAYEKKNRRGSSYELVRVYTKEMKDDEEEYYNVFVTNKRGTAKVWLSNAQYGSKEIGTSEVETKVYKGRKEDRTYAKLDYYYGPEMAGKKWYFYYKYTHNHGEEFEHYLGSADLSNTMGLKQIDLAKYKCERTGPKQFSFTPPALPGDVSKDLRDIRKRYGKYLVTMTYHLYGSDKTVVKTDTIDCPLSEVSATYGDSYNIEIPDEVGNYRRVDMKVEAAERLDGSNANNGADGTYYWKNAATYVKNDMALTVPVASNIKLSYLQFENKIVLTWNAYDNVAAGKYYSDSEPYIYRIETDENGKPISGQSWSRRTKLDSISTKTTLTYTDRGAEVNKYYRYMIMNVPKRWQSKGFISDADLKSPTDDLIKQVGCCQSDIIKTEPTMTISNLAQDMEQKKQVRLTWQYSRVPVSQQTVDFYVYRRQVGTSQWTEHGKVTADANPSANTVCEIIDKDLPNSSVSFEYQVTLYINNKANHFHSDVVAAGLLSKTTVTELTATQGTYAGGVRVSWKADHVGTDDAQYRVYRRYLGTNDEYYKVYDTYGKSSSYSFVDDKVQPGYYYEYKTEVHQGDVGDANTMQNALKAVGFAQARGIVAGRITYAASTTSTTPVEGARVSLRPSDGSAISTSSQRVDGASTGMQWQADSTEMAKVFGSDKNFTVQMFVRPDSALSEGAVLGEIPGEGRFVLGKQTIDGYELNLQKITGYAPTVKVAPMMVDNTVDLSKLTGNYEAKNGDVLTNKLGGNYKISIADGASVKLKNVTIEGVNSQSYKWAGITCPGNATIVLEGENTLRGFEEGYPGIYIAENKTLTIKGIGSLSASSTGYAPGIGGTYYQACGNIVIEGGTITAHGGKWSAGIGSAFCHNCGDITIKGGDITVNGGEYSAGIGAGDGGICGNITIKNTVTSVKATKDSNGAPHCIGHSTSEAAHNSSCGTVTIGDVVYWDGSTYKNGGENIITQMTYTYSPNGSWQANDHSNSDPVFTHIKEGYTIPGYITYSTAASTGLKLSANAYSLLTVSRTGDNLSFLADNSTGKTLTANKYAHLMPFSVGGADSVKTANAFKGNLTEVRVWNKALSEAEIAACADRVLNGRESGLALYWPMDEGLSNFVFDASYAKELPNGRHATVGINISTSTMVPTEKQLSRYGVTNADGRYEIRGIPFIGEATGYTLTPTLGIHEFQPESQSVIINANSLTKDQLDFSDKSSFPLRGQVTYLGTNIPVDSVQFMIDGSLVQSKEGIYSDANGNYEISVPIGKHRIECVKNGHRLTSFPLDKNEKYYFHRAEVCNFADSTLVNVTGRVNGGFSDQEAPLGFAQSKNRIGKAEIKLSIGKESQCSFNYVVNDRGEGNFGTTDMPVKSASADIKSTAYRSGTTHDKITDNDNTHYIYITTDSLTGEFSALLPPLKYVVESIRMVGGNAYNDEPVFAQNLPTIDATTADEKKLKYDSLTVDGVTKKYTYSGKMIRQLRVEPEIVVRQLNRPSGMFGELKVAYTNDKFETDSLVVLNPDNPGKKYTFDHPIFVQSNAYGFSIDVAENYTNLDTKKTIKEYPQDAWIHISNEASATTTIYGAKGAIGKDSVEMGMPYETMQVEIQPDEYGHAEYEFVAGAPNLAEGHLLGMSVSVRGDDGRTTMWKAPDSQSDALDLIVLGAIGSGTNFMTYGPDEIDMILRRPPGSTSVARLTNKEVTVNSHTKVNTDGHSAGGGLYVSEAPTFDNLEGAIGPIALLKGTKWKIVTNQTVKRDNRYSDTELTQNDSTYAVTTAMSTPGSMQYLTDLKKYIPEAGDTYIGRSTNMLFSRGRMLGIFKNANTGKYGIEERSGITVGQELRTYFVFPQAYVLNTLIPEWEELITSRLKEGYINADHTDSTNCPKVPGKVMYYTKYKPGDREFGKANGDLSFWTKAQIDAAKGHPSYFRRVDDSMSKDTQDEVENAINQIKRWREVIAVNEEEKVNAFGNSELLIDNYSIASGSSVSRTEEYTYTKNHTEKHDSTYCVTLDINAGAMINEAGGYAIINSAWTWGRQTSTGKTSSTSTSVAWTMSDADARTALSVDVYKSENGWGPIFRTRGGQTANPYEDGSVTMFYDPGTKLNEATMRVEKPELHVKGATEITDVPTGGKALFTLQMSNQSESNSVCNYVLQVVDKTNPNGAVLTIDGNILSNGKDGRLIKFNPNEEMLKTLVVTQSDEAVVNYEDIELVLRSQNDATIKSDPVKLRVHFVPASSPVELAVDHTVLNEKDKTLYGGVMATMSGFDRNSDRLKGVRLRYRRKGTDAWTQLAMWSNETAYQQQGALALRDTSAIKKEVSFNNDGLYELQAQTWGLYGGSEVTYNSNIVEILQDTHGPKLLGMVSPENGLLTWLNRNNMHIRFNERLNVNAISQSDNIIIEGGLNDVVVDEKRPYPDVALQLNGDSIQTEALYDLSDTGFALDMWLYRQGDGKIVSLGTNSNLLSLSTHDGGLVSVALGEEDNVMDAIARLPENTWTYMAMNYQPKDDDKSMGELTLLYATDDKTNYIFQNEEIEALSCHGKLSVGGSGMQGMIGRMSVWNSDVTAEKLYENRNKLRAPYTPGLIGYWKMDEGHGTQVTDIARSRHMQMPTESWYINNENRAAHLDGKEGSALKIDVSTFQPTSTDDFAYEMWFRGNKADNQATSTLMSVNNMAGGKTSIGFDSSKLKLKVSDNDYILSDKNYLDGNWHHLAFNVRRGISAIAYMDGEPVKVLPESNIPGIMSQYLVVGGELTTLNPQPSTLNCFTGDVDEIRIWKASVDAQLIKDRMYERIDSGYPGLEGYFPMEDIHRNQQGTVQTYFSLDNLGDADSRLTMVKDSVMVGEEKVARIRQALNAPGLKVGSSKMRLDASQYDFTVSDDELYLTFKNSTLSQMDGNEFIVTVSNIKDEHGNKSWPVSWKFHTDFASLKWNIEEDVLSKPWDEVMEWQVYVANQTGTAQSYELSGMPTWLTVDKAIGTITGDGGFVKFRLGTDVPVGRHTEYIYLTDQLGIRRVLKLNLTVMGDVPNWEVDPDLYESNMTLTGQIYINDRICENSDTKIAAFDDLGLCRGVASPKYVRTRDAYYVDMVIYGASVTDVSSGIRDLTFKVYDASTGTIHPMVGIVVPGKDYALSMQYAPDVNYGSYDTPVVLDVANALQQQISLAKGWTWMSIYVNPLIDQLEWQLPRDKNILKRFKNMKSQTDGFATVDKDGVIGGNLSYLQPGKMYKMQLSTKTDFDLIGLALRTDTLPQTMHPGYNWIGTLSSSVMSVDEAFSELQPVPGDRVKSRTAFAEFSNKGYWEGTLESIVPGQGYIYRSTASEEKTFHYPSGKAGASQSRQDATLASRRGTESSHFTPVDPYLYPDNLSIIAVVKKDGVERDDAEIAAFIDGECRGAVSYKNGYYFLTAMGSSEEDGQKKMELRVYVDGEEYTVDDSLPFISDAFYGSLDEPYVLDIDATAIRSIAADDTDDDDDWWTLQGFKIGRKPTQPGVYIHHGKKVTIKRVK